MINIIPEETWSCKSTDTKPTVGVQDNQCILEKDTGKVFIFDKESGEWLPL